MQKHILFYSNYCPYSKKFLHFLDQSNELSNFIGVCVDKNRATGLRDERVMKFNVKEVPSIITNNKLLSGNEAFKWIYKIIEFNNEKQEDRHIPDNNTPSRAVTANSEVKPLLSFDSFSSSMTNITDSCVNIDNGIIGETEKIITYKDGETFDRGTIKLVDDCITGEKNNTTVKTSSSSGMKNKDSLKSKQFDNAYNKMLMDRENNIPQPPVRQ